jgi:hypothetical protein
MGLMHEMLLISLHSHASASYMRWLRILRLELESRSATSYRNRS